jgi:hypothetical protein
VPLIRIVRIIGAVIAGVLALGVLLVVVDANEDNALVNAVLEVARFFAAPFRGIIELDDNKLQIAINWGIAALVYLAIAALVAAAIRALVSRRDRGAASDPER